MDAKLFENKAKGDFYLYYRKSDSNKITYLVGTRDLHESSYIMDRLPSNVKSNVNPDGSLKIVANEDGSLNLLDKKGKVAVWSWNSDKLRYLNLSRVTRIVPLESVLRN